MPFKGDKENLRPLAWVTLWKTTHNNLFGWYIPDSFRDWGYAIWDAGRLVNSGAVASRRELVTLDGEVNSMTLETPFDAHVYNTTRLGFPA